jgi:hypothetical protein
MTGMVMVGHMASMTEQLGVLLHPGLSHMSRSFLDPFRFGSVQAVKAFSGVSFCQFLKMSKFCGHIYHKV